MKRFMFLSIGVLCLAIAVLIGFYVGSQRAEAANSSNDTYVSCSVLSTGSGAYFLVAMNSKGEIKTGEILGGIYGSALINEKSIGGF
jgi:uncharacterized membrane protein (DUF441 family)